MRLSHIQSGYIYIYIRLTILGAFIYRLENRIMKARSRSFCLFESVCCKESFSRWLHDVSYVEHARYFHHFSRVNGDLLKTNCLLYTVSVRRVTWTGNGSDFTIESSDLERPESLL